MIRHKDFPAHTRQSLSDGQSGTAVDRTQTSGDFILAVLSHKVAAASMKQRWRGPCAPVVCYAAVSLLSPATWISTHSI